MDRDDSALKPTEIPVSPLSANGRTEFESSQIKKFSTTVGYILQDENVWNGRVPEPFFFNVQEKLGYTFVAPDRGSDRYILASNDQKHLLLQHVLWTMYDNGMFRHHPQFQPEIFGRRYRVGIVQFVCNLGRYYVASVLVAGKEHVPLELSWDNSPPGAADIAAFPPSDTGMYWRISSIASNSLGLRCKFRVGDYAVHIVKDPVHGEVWKMFEPDNIYIRMDEVVLPTLQVHGIESNPYWL